MMQHPSCFLSLFLSACYSCCVIAGNATCVTIVTNVGNRNLRHVVVVGNENDCNYEEALAPGDTYNCTVSK